MRKLRSDITREGLARTPHRAFMRAMGLDDAAIQKPMIGVVSMKGEQTPCNMTHGFQVEAAKEGVTGPAARRASSRRSRSPTASA
jgi:dihydroxy-acid dehydratase